MFHDLLGFNKEKLFFRLNGLSDFITRDCLKTNNAVDDGLLKDYIDEFFSKVEFLYLQKKEMLAIRDFVQAQFKEGLSTFNVKYIPSLLLPRDQLMIFSTRYSNQLVLMIPSLLNTISILQDRILRIIGLVKKFPLKKKKKDKNPLAIPQDFSYFFDGDRIVQPKECLTQFGKRIEALTLSYWKSYGKAIRKYRNVDQHQFNILYHYGVNSKGEFLVYLPDDPFVKNKKNITFNAKYEAISLIEKNFSAFHQYVEDIMKEMGIPEKEHNVNFDITSVRPSKNDWKDGTCICCHQMGGNLAFWYVNGEELITKPVKLITRELHILYDKMPTLEK